MLTNFRLRRACNTSLCSSEGHVFYVDRRCAKVSKTISAALSGMSFFYSTSCSPPPRLLPGNFRESEGEVSLSGISTAILEKVIQYFHYKLKYSNSKVPPPEFDIKPEYANELLIAANYLDC